MSLHSATYQDHLQLPLLKLLKKMKHAVFQPNLVFSQILANSFISSGFHVTQADYAVQGDLDFLILLLEWQTSSLFRVQSQQ